MKKGRVGARIAGLLSAVWHRHIPPWQRHEGGETRLTSNHGRRRDPAEHRRFQRPRILAGEVVAREQQPWNGGRDSRPPQRTPPGKRPARFPYHLCPSPRKQLAPPAL